MFVTQVEMGEGVTKLVMNENLDPQLVAPKLQPPHLTVSDTTNSHQETAVPPSAGWLDPEIVQTSSWTASSARKTRITS